MYNIIQFGEGNFLRAFAEYYIQTVKNNGVAYYSLAICQPRKNNKVISALKMQDNKYNVLIRGRRNGEIINDVMHIDCVNKCIDTTTELDFLISAFVSNDLKIVISNTTEAGIAYSADDVCGDYYNCTFPAKITYLLHERFLSGADGILFLPIELIENNADELKECILKYADLWQFGDDFKQYVINECSFCNTLVDRIVTGYTEYKDDKCAVACEPYGSWIIQADSRCKQLLPENISDDIVFTDDITPYRTRKVRILNGVHTMSVLAAFLCDIDIVRDMMNDEIGFGRKVLQVIEEAGLSYEHTPSGIDTMNVIVELNSFIEHEQEILANLHRAVEPDSIELESDLALIAIVGRGMKDGRGVAAKVFTALANKKINVKMIDQGSSELNIIVGVKNIHFNEAIRAIYNTFIEQE